MFWATFDLSSAIAFNVGKPKILSFGQGLRLILGENIGGKGENAYYELFSFSQNISRRLLPQGC